MRSRTIISCRLSRSMGMGRHRFTLMEVMIAALILAMSVASAVGVIGTARANMLREERRWEREHAMGNAMEFFLLAGPENTLPPEALPEGYAAECVLFNVEENIPEEAMESIRGWRLGEFQVRLYAPGGRMADEQQVRKIIKEEDVDYRSLGAER